MQGYDVIGDVHGRADLLVKLLEQLGYSRQSGVFVHPERQAIFIGDIIDYGPQQRETLHLIQKMVAVGSAQVVLGNHEFNAVAFATPDPNDSSRFLRPHSNKNRVQHKAFLAEFASQPNAYQAAINWFKSLPLFLELNGAGFIHAAWSEPLIGQLRPMLNPDNSLPDSLWIEACQRGSWQYEAIEKLLKGPEVTLPTGYFFNDKHGHQRNDIRAKWWLPEPQDYRELALVPHGQEQYIPTLPIREPLRGFGREGLVFNGHYWLRGQPHAQSDKVICTDYSGDNKLTAYRWSFEATPNNAHFVQVG